MQRTPCDPDWADTTDSAPRCARCTKRPARVAPAARRVARARRRRGAAHPGTVLGSVRRLSSATTGDPSSPTSRARGSWTNGGATLRPGARERGFWRPGPGPDDFAVVLAVASGFAMLFTALVGDLRWEFGQRRPSWTAPGAKDVVGDGGCTPWWATVWLRHGARRHGSGLHATPHRSSSIELGMKQPRAFSTSRTARRRPDGRGPAARGWVTAWMWPAEGGRSRQWSVTDSARRQPAATSRVQDVYKDWTTSFLVYGTRYGCVEGPVTDIPVVLR
jgi:hypothetical protein